MSSSSTGTPSKVFLTGATGYIGGSILSSLLKHPNKYTVSALVRQKEQGEVLKQHGVTPVYGTLDDSEVLFEAARASDAVVHTADADHLPSAQALVRGLSAKKDKQHAVYLHTSGTGVLTYDGVIEVHVRTHCNVRTGEKRAKSERKESRKKAKRRGRGRLRREEGKTHPLTLLI